MARPLPLREVLLDSCALPIEDADPGSDSEDPIVEAPLDIADLQEVSAEADSGCSTELVLIQSLT